jgi:hypothetical protein
LERPYKRPFFLKINKKDKSPRIKKENLLIVERRKFRVWIHKRREPRLRRDARDPIDSHRQEYGINFQNKSCCDSRR